MAADRLARGMFDRAQHAKELRARLETSAGNLMETAAGDWWRPEGVEQLALDAEIADLDTFRGQRRTANS